MDERKFVFCCSGQRLYEIFIMDMNVVFLKQIKFFAAPLHVYSIQRNYISYVNYITQYWKRYTVAKQIEGTAIHLPMQVKNRVKMDEVTYFQPTAKEEEVLQQITTGRTRHIPLKNLT